MVDGAVIGGGPAGAATALRLRQAGRSVILFEAQRFPRFHIGESLLPRGNQLLRELGVLEAVQAAGFTLKRGAEFTTPRRERSVENVFAEGYLPDLEAAFQVDRARFDALLLQAAKAAGADVREGHRVLSMETEAGGWTLKVRDAADGRVTLHRARFLVDASGRRQMVARRLKVPKEPLPYPPRVAVYSHFKGTRPTAGLRAGNIVITRLGALGWFWMIPLGADRLSVGVVLDKQVFQALDATPEAVFRAAVDATPSVRDVLDPAAAVEPFRVEADYCYSATAYAGPRHLLVGDAASFIDPIFSSGVCLALESGSAAGLLLARALERGQQHLTPRQQRHYTRGQQRKVRMMRHLIECFYDSGRFAVFMTPKPLLDLPAVVNSVVAGQTQLPWRARWRMGLFLLLCRLNRRWGFVQAPAPEVTLETLARHAAAPTHPPTVAAMSASGDALPPRR